MPRRKAVETDEPVLTPKQVKLLQAAEEIQAQEPTNDEKAYLTRYMVQATLPHRSPVGNPPFWSRTNGNYTLVIRPGIAKDRATRKVTSIGYPSGTIPRLLMFWITTEALRTGARRLELGGSLAKFMQALGLNHRNGGSGSQRSDRHRLREQMERLFRATISFQYDGLNVTQWLDMPVAPKGEIWWNVGGDPEQATLWNSWIELGEEFYKAIISAPVPVDIRALQELKQSPLALDLYAWATYTTYQANHTGKSRHIPWSHLAEQMGSDYAEPKDFRRKAQDALRKIRLVYPGLRLEEGRGSIVIHPGRTAVSS